MRRRFSVGEQAVILWTISDESGQREREDYQSEANDRRGHPEAQSVRFRVN